MKSIQEIFTRIYKDDKYMKMTKRQCLESLYPLKEKLLQEWIDSGHSDYGIYTDEKYIAELLICYYDGTGSRGMINHLLKYFKEKTEVWIANLSIYDEYNGFGLTTLQLLEAGFKHVFYSNPSEMQVTLFKELCVEAGYLTTLDNVDDGIRQYDIVCSFEVAEHFKNPIEYIEKLVSRVKDNGYLIFSSTFGRIDPGHFLEYEVNGQLKTIKAAGREVGNIIRKHFELQEQGWNGKPRIYRKKQ